MSKKLLILIIAVMFINGLPAHSQPQARTVTMEDAIVMSIKNNHDVKSSRLFVQKARQQVREAFGSALPSLNLSATYTRNILKPVFFFPNVFGTSLPFEQFPFVRDPQKFADWERMRDSLQSLSGSGDNLQKIEIGEDNSFQVAGALTQTVFNSAIFKAIGTAKIYEEAATETLNSSIVKAVNDTRKAYYGALLAREAVRTLQASYEKGRENVQTVQLLYKEGMIPEFDQIRAEVAVENIQPAVFQAETGYTNALNALKLAMGIEISENIDVEGELLMPATEDNYDEDRLLGTIMEKNYDLRALEIQKRVTDDIITLRKSEYYPVVTLSGNYVYQGQSNTFKFDNTAQSAGVSLNLSMNLFSGFQSSARVEQARIDLQTIDEKLQQAKEGIRMQVKNYLLQIEASKRRIEAQKRTVGQATRGYEIAQIRYKEGTGSQTEINETDIALRQARTNAAQAVHDYLVAKSELDALVGALDGKYLRLAAE